MEAKTSQWINFSLGSWQPVLCSNDFKDYIAGHGVLGSMSRKGNCWDNELLWLFKERTSSLK